MPRTGIGVFICQANKWGMYAVTILYIKYCNHRHTFN